MKIYGDYSFVLNRLNIMDQSKSQIQFSKNGVKIIEFADKFIERQKAESKDQVAISKEGMDYIRDQLSDLRSGMSSGSEDGKNLSLITGDKMSLMDGLCKSYISLHLDSVDEEGVSRNLYMDMDFQYRQGMNDRDTKDWNSHMESLADAYASEYKKIVEGYRDGTREVWVQDFSTGEDFSGVELEVNGQPVRYRKLTKEEELEYLDQSMGKLVEEKANQFAKEELERKRGELVGKRDALLKEYYSSDEFMRYLETMATDLVDETMAMMERVKRRLDELLGPEEPDIDIGGRMEQEAYNHRVETVAYRNQQTQLQNYRKMSEMEADARTLLGYIKA